VKPLKDTLAAPRISIEAILLTEEPQEKDEGPDGTGKPGHIPRKAVSDRDQEKAGCGRKKKQTRNGEEHRERQIISPPELFRNA
jgi:hypothetical protein